MYSRPGMEFIIKDTHRGLWYEDGKLTRVLEAGKYKIPRRWWPVNGPTVDVELIDKTALVLLLHADEMISFARIQKAADDQIALARNSVLLALLPAGLDLVPDRLQ